MFNQKLTLKKTHDHCVSDNPELTVIMIHGLAANSSDYNTALQYLEGTTSLKNIRFVTYDLLGSGESPKSNKFNYDYEDQLTALHNSIEKLNLTTPLVLVGHSMGTLIVTRYAATYKKSVKALILLSPPIYTKADIESPDFSIAMQMFDKIIAKKYPGVTATKCYQNSVKYIVSNKTNYRVLKDIKTPAFLIWGDEDAVIASFNIPTILKENPKYLTAIKTAGKHGISRDKYNKLVPILEKVLNGEKLTNPVKN